MGNSLSLSEGWGFFHRRRAFTPRLSRDAASRAASCALMGNAKGHAPFGSEEKGKGTAEPNVSRRKR
jgi:hypothetical protein